MKIDSSFPVMCLPDHAFGRRYPIWVQRLAAAGSYGWDLAETAFPDRMVLWGMGWWVYGDTDNTGRIRLALGDRIPGSLAEMDRAKPFRVGLGRKANTGELGYIYVGGGQSSVWIPMRDYMEAQGERLVLEVDADSTDEIMVHVCVVVSSIPRSVPDWVSSGLQNYRL